MVLKASARLPISSAVTTAGAQGVVLFAGYLARQFFQFVDRPGNRRLICRAMISHSSTLKIRIPRLAVSVPVYKATGSSLLATSSKCPEGWFLPGAG